jgi:hypothetical protein
MIVQTPSNLKTGKHLNGALAKEKADPLCLLSAVRLPGETSSKRRNRRPLSSSDCFMSSWTQNTGRTYQKAALQRLQGESSIST